ncbi:MAG: hypothetical protein ABEH43_05835, partial [Flavobacteriales bacterium]
NENTTKTLLSGIDSQEKESFAPFQVHDSYIISPIHSGVIFIDQQKAHERILFEKFLNKLKDTEAVTQQQLFPKRVELNKKEMTVIEEMKDTLGAMGFDIGELGDTTLVINGVPSECTDEENIESVIESLIDQYQFGMKNDITDNKKKVAMALGRSVSVKKGKKLAEKESKQLIDELFACEVPYYTPDRKPTIVTFTLDELAKRFEK